jgi:hypothetical protein
MFLCNPTPLNAEIRLAEGSSHGRRMRELTIPQVTFSEWFPDLKRVTTQSIINRLDPVATESTLGMGSTSFC